jgi:hypothetical protein
MDDKFEQRVFIKFRVKLANSATETFEMIRLAFGEHSLSRTAVFEWHLRFKTGLESVEDDEISGRPSTSKTTVDIEKVQELFHEDRRRKIRKFADTVEISYGVC